MTVAASEVPVVVVVVTVVVVVVVDGGGSDDDERYDADVGDDASMMVKIHHLADADADADDMMVDHTLHYSNDTLVVHR